MNYVKMTYLTGLWLFIISWSMLSTGHANNARDLALTINTSKMPLRQALMWLAQQQGHNIIISPAINTWVSLNFIKTKPSQIFAYLLAAHGLSQASLGEVWYVAPTAEIQHNELNTPLATIAIKIAHTNATNIVTWLRTAAIKCLSTRGQLSVDKRTNTVFVRDTPAQLQLITTIVHALDIPSAQVRIEARLVSVDSNYEQHLGISSFNPSHDTHPPGQVVISRLFNNKALDVQLAALEHQGHGELISKPSIITANQEPALIEAGEDIPYQEFGNNGTTAVVFRKAALSLLVTPQILPSHDIILALEINQDRPTNLNGTGIPVIATRHLKTRVIVPSGHTIVLGGIYELTTQHRLAAVPWLSKIPLLAWLLKFTQRSQDKRDLLVFITPTIATELKKTHDELASHV